LTEESLIRFADELTTLYGDEGETEVWLDSLEDLRALSTLFVARGLGAEVNFAKQTLTVRFK